jgi:hypothetical protein
MPVSQNAFIPSDTSRDLSPLILSEFTIRYLLRAGDRFMSLPSAHDLGGENPYIDTKDVLKLLNCRRLGRQAAGHPWSALRVGLYREA